jgi:CIC family chloride channel protein
VVDFATTEGLLVAYPDEPMWKALKRLGTRDVGRLPVVQDEASRQLVGAIRRQDIIRAYNQAIVKRAHHQHRAETLRLGKLDGAGFHTSASRQARRQRAGGSARSICPTIA